MHPGEDELSSPCKPSADYTSAPRMGMCSCTPSGGVASAVLFAHFSKPLVSINSEPMLVIRDCLGTQIEVKMVHCRWIRRKGGERMSVRR